MNYLRHEIQLIETPITEFSKPVELRLKGTYDVVLSTVWLPDALRLFRTAVRAVSR